MKNYKVKLISTHAAAGTLVKATKAFSFSFQFYKKLLQIGFPLPLPVFSLCLNSIFTTQSPFCVFALSCFPPPSLPCCGFEVMQAWLFLALGTSVLLCCPLHLQYLLCPDGPDAQPNCHSKLAVPHTPLSIPMSTPASAGSVLYSQHYFSSYHHTLVTGS